MKICARCSQTKPIEEFSKNDQQKDSRHVYCKDCVSIYAKNRRQEHREEFIERGINSYIDSSKGLVKVCPRCRLTRPTDEFFKNRSQPSGLSSLCWECHSKEEKYRVLLLKEKIFEKLGKICCKCGFSKDIRALQIDHVFSDGKAERNLGPMGLYKKVIQDQEGRYQILCANCNIIKRIESKESRISLKRRRS